MSRAAASKARADKGGKSSSAPAPTVTHEIVPGKYNDQDWNFMIDHDDGDEFIQDIAEEICTNALDFIYGNYIQQQLIPYTVIQAKDAILQIIEWQFLSRDQGEEKVETDVGWLQDEEPEPAVTDCWAQGSVPRVRVPVKTPLIEEVIEEIPEPAEEEVPAQEDEEQEREEEEEVAESEENTGEDSIPVEEDDIVEEQVDSEPETQREMTQQEVAKKKKFKPHKGPLKSAGLGKMTESLEETEMKMLATEKASTTSQDTESPDPAMMHMPSSCHSILKLQAGRPPGNREVVYDDSGNVMSVTRIDPSKLPSHRVKTLFHIVDPRVETAQARLEAMRTGRYQVSKDMEPTPPKTSPRSTTKTVRAVRRVSHGGATGSTKTQPYGKSKEGVAPLPPPLIECMEVAPGVIVKEGERTKTGPRHIGRRFDVIEASSKGLRPVTIRSNMPTVTVAELLERQSPVVRPMPQTPPIPPISPHANRAQPIFTS